MTDPKAARSTHDQLATIESWADRRPNIAEKQRRALRLAAIWFAVIVVEIVVVGVVYRAVMSHVASL